MESVVSLSSGPYVSSDIDDLLAVEDLGPLRLPARPGQQPTEARVLRLSLLRLSGDEFRAVWQSRPLLASTAAPLASAWTPADIDSDGRLELLIFSGDSCQVLRFGPDSVRTRTFGLPNVWVTDAVACDINADTVTEVVALELSAADTLMVSRLLRVYQPSDSGFVPLSGYISGLDWGSEVGLLLTGTARFQDYWTELPVLAAIYPDLRPSTYAILYQLEPDSFCLSFNPFPWREWFAKDLVLPAGQLVLFNTGDTLIAYGYFVPGARASGPTESFAALLDGEWRLLPFAAGAERLGGPLCRFSLGETSGWLELRDRVFRFHPGDVFSWPEEP